MKILAGDQFDSDVDENAGTGKPREVKASKKLNSKQELIGDTKLLATSKIGRLVST